MEKTSTLLVHFDKGTPALANEIKEAMKKAVMLLLKGETIPSNVDEVVLLLKKEVMKIQNAELENNGEYNRQVLLQAIHACAIESPEVASTVVHVLMNFLGDTNVASAMDVVVFVWEIIETNPELRVSIITRLLGTFYQIRAARVCSCALWIIGEYCLSLSEVESGIATIKQCLGDLSFYTPTEEGEGSEAPKPTQPMSNVTTASSRRPVVLADGTYDTQSAALETAMSRQTLVLRSLASHGNLRSLLWAGDFFLGAVIACTLTKLVLRLEGVQPSKTEVNRETTQTLLILVSMLQLGQSSFLPHPIDNDSCDRIVLFIRLLSNTGDETRKIWLQSCRQSFVKMLADKQVPETEERKAKAQVSHAQPDDLDFYHLKSRKGMSQLELEDKVQDDLKRATGEFTKDNDDAKKLNRILQLTGFSDPVYAEAYVTVHDYDIVLDVTVINRTKETLQNLCLELATLGDLKLVEHPQTLAPESSKQIRANIKVSSTETRVIVQNIVYEISNVMERKVVALNNIHIPATCADTAFRTMWAEFESENKGSTPLKFLYSDATESPPPIRVGFLFPGEHSPGGGHNVIWGLHDALKVHNNNNILLGFRGGTEGLSAQKTLEITGDILSTYKNQRGHDLCRSTKDQIRITEQVNAALAACKALKLDGLVVVGGVTANTDAAQLKKTFEADKRRTMVAGVPVNFNGDVKVNFVETNVGVDTICKYYCYFIRLVDLKESQFALESALRSQPNTVVLNEELDLDDSKLTFPHLANKICEAVQAWAEQDKYHGVIRFPEGLIKRMPPSVHALPQSTREKLLAQLVEKEIEKREKAGTYKGKKFNAICHFFGYQAPGSLPSESDCDDANVCGCQAQLLGHICYDLLATDLKDYDESQKLSNAGKTGVSTRNERRREQHKMKKEVERAAKKKEEPKSQIEGRARSEAIRSQMEELGVKELPKLPKEKQPKPKKKKEINMNRNVVL